jgi:hypothetical protein
MPKRIRKPKRPADVNQWAYAIGQQSTEPESLPVPTKAQISRIMSAMGTKGGKIGGKRRLVTMTPEERSRVALKAAHARWKKQRKVTQP